MSLLALPGTSLWLCGLSGCAAAGRFAATALFHVAAGTPSLVTGLHGIPLEDGSDFGRSGLELSSCRSCSWSEGLLEVSADAAELFSADAATVFAYRTSPSLSTVL